MAKDRGDKEKKEKKEKKRSEPMDPIRKPPCRDKVAKKVLKSVKKGSLNTICKCPITTPSAIVVLAADISPMDVISHIPVLCEDHGIPYIYVSSRAELGNAGATKRPTSVVMVLPKGGKNKKKDEKESDDKKEDFSAVYDELVKVVQKETKKVKI
ncbi:non-histone protein [Microsporum canis CBS 113480]|uniref:Non-histone protein n=1 Tax=Arthroderma otae (strain ATCC MYA-4605 / CBS 113480) TaxID=554155 RepID=C5FKE8_ARTOC|nr:non-histone protein [Microsporum canis CBS 113480]EEQ30170.1 non-histone protein [Microsporum canis CBS 113480]